MAGALDSLDARLLNNLAPALDVGGDEIRKFFWRGAFRLGSKRDQARTDALIRKHLSCRSVEALNHRIWSAGRRHQGEPGADVEAWKAGFPKRRCIRQTRKACRPCDRKSYKLARLEVLNHRERRVDHEIDPPSEHLDYGQCATPKRHVCEFYPGALREHFSSQVGARADAGCPVGNGPTLLSAHVEHLPQGLRGMFCMRHEDVRGLRQQADPSDVLDRPVGELSV